MWQRRSSGFSTAYLLWEDICKAFYRDKPVHNNERGSLAEDRDTFKNHLLRGMKASAILNSAMNCRSYLKIKVKSRKAKNKTLRNNLLPPKIIGESNNWKEHCLTEEWPNTWPFKNKPFMTFVTNHLTSNIRYPLLSTAREHMTTAVLSALKNIPTPNTASTADL